MAFVLCPASAALLCLCLCKQPKLQDRLWYVAAWQRVASNGYRVQGSVHEAVVDLKTTLRRLSQVLALPVKYATRSRRVYGCVWLCMAVCVPLCLCLCLCLQMLIDYTVRDEIITSN